MSKTVRLCRLTLCALLATLALTISAAAIDTSSAPQLPSTDTAKTTVQSDQPFLMPVEIAPPKLGDIFTQLMFGQEVRARDGAIYYESADAAGSGRQGQSNNRYTEKLYIAGFAIVDETGRLVDYQCYLRDNLPVGELAPDFVADCKLYGELFIATCTDGYTTGSVGWFRSNDLLWKLGSLEYQEPTKDPAPDDPEPWKEIFYYNPEPDDGLHSPKDEDEDPSAFSPETGNSVAHYVPILKDVLELVNEQRITPQDVATAIEDSASQGEKIALVLDASGSVNKYSAAIASYAEQVDNAECVIAFAGGAKVITADKYSNVWLGFFGSFGTNIYNALNLIPDEPFDHVILVTDTLHYGGGDINARDDIGAITILNPIDEDRQDVLDTIEQQWGITPIVCRLSDDGTIEEE